MTSRPRRIIAGEEPTGRVSSRRKHSVWGGLEPERVLRVRIQVGAKESVLRAIEQ